MESVIGATIHIGATNHIEATSYIETVVPKLLKKRE
jgi:hypothetical protein